MITRNEDKAMEEEKTLQDTNACLLQDDDLKDLFAELEKETKDRPQEEDKEMEASQRRYQEIINKHRKD